MPTTTNTINDVSQALKEGIPPNIIRWALVSEGIPGKKAETMIRWALQLKKVSMATYHLHRWSVGELTSPYAAPEARLICLYGFRDQEEKSVRTSAVVEVKGREIHTENSIYILEDPSPEYLSWMQENHIEYDPENPIRVRKI